MLKKQYRINDSKRIKKIIHNGNKIEFPYMDIYLFNEASSHSLKNLYDENGNFIPQKLQSFPEQVHKVNLCIIASAKTGKSHDRNLFKRRIKFVVLSIVDSQYEYIVVRAKSKLKDIKFEQIKSDLTKIFNDN